MNIPVQVHLDLEDVVRNDLTDTQRWELVDHLLTELKKKASPEDWESFVQDWLK